MIFGCSGSAFSEDNTQELAKKLSNPIASMISVPIQFNYDTGYGSESGQKSSINIQPVIPFSINEDWNMISRTIVPITEQSSITGPSGDQFGLGDITQSFFFSPKQPTENGIIWGVGPVLLVPTATNPLLGAEKWGAGPTGVMLKQFDGWTVGMLANHIWSFAGDRNRADVSSTFMQPFISYTTSNAWTFTLNTEGSYNWEAKDWSAPVNFTVSKIAKLDKQPVSFTVGARYWADSPTGGPEGWGVRAGITFLFPK